MYDALQSRRAFCRQNAAWKICVRHPQLHEQHRASSRRIRQTPSRMVFLQTASSQNSAPDSDSNGAATIAQQPQGGQWVPPYGQPIAGKTRAEVYQELVHAEQDGQLAYLNSTLYAHH